MDGTTPILAAASRGHLAAVKLLLTMRVPIEGCDEKGRTALYLAADRGHKKCAESLVMAGANVGAAYVAIGKTSSTWRREAKVHPARS